jgi:hypothetical protein
MKKIITLTELDLTRIVKRVINESYNDTKKNLIISRNNETLKNIKNKYLSDSSINKTVGKIITNAAEKFVKNVNSKAGEITKQILSGNGSATATLYLETLKDVIYSTVNDLSLVEKKLISTFVSKDEFNKIIKNFDIIITDIYDRLIIDSFLYMHDPQDKPNEAKWYDKAYNVATSRKTPIKTHLVDWIKGQIFG